MSVARKGKWSKSETQFLKENYLEKGVKVCAFELVRTVSAIYQKAALLGIIKEPRYTGSELENIKLNYAAKGPTALSKEMNRGYHAIRDMAVRLGLSVGSDVMSNRGRLNRSRWTDKSRASHSSALKKKRGPLSPSWKGGVCNLSEVIRGRLYTAWTKYVFQRDAYTCRLCGEVGGKMVVHHVRTFAEIRDAVIKEHPELDIGKYEDLDRFADLVIDSHKLSDGVTLCRSCHQVHHLENGVNCGDILTGGAEDNPQPSRLNVLDFVGRKVQRLTGEDAQSDKPDTSAPLLESLAQMR